MSELRKTTPDDLYFLTLTVAGWIDLFSREIYKEIIINNLRYCREKEGLEVFAYVIMSNHLHLVCRRKDKDLKELIGRFKSYTSKLFLNEIRFGRFESRNDWLLPLFRKLAGSNRQNGRYHIWEHADYPVCLYSNHIIEQKIEYIHENPIRAGIVTEAESYKYGSASVDSPLRVSEMQ